MKLSPCSMVVLFSGMSILLNIDRASFSSVIPIIQSNSNDGLGLSDFLTGTLGSAFTVGFVLSAQLVAYFTRKYHPENVLCVGLLIWVGSELFTGFSKNY